VFSARGGAVSRRLPGFEIGRSASGLGHLVKNRRICRSGVKPEGYSAMTITILERVQRMARWGLKPCVHPRFVEVAGEADKRACMQCGEFFDDIVQQSSHPEGNIPHAADFRVGRPSLLAAQHSAAPQGESTRPECIEPPGLRQATRPLLQYNHGFVTRPQTPEQRRTAALRPHPRMVVKPFVETGNSLGRSPRHRLYVSPLQRRLLECLRERYPAYMAPVFERDNGTALLVDTGDCERLLQVIPHSGRTARALDRKVANLLDVMRRQGVSSVENQERVGEASLGCAAN